jgi:replicative DNA helicase
MVSTSRVIEYRPVNGAHLAALEERNSRPVRAVATPFDEWNTACGGMGGMEGLAYGWHVLGAGRSGQGKTYLAANLAAAAVARGEAVAFHSLEMDWDELSIRTMSILSDVPAYKLSSGKHFSREAFRQARSVMDAFGGELQINHEPMNTLEHVVSGIRRMSEQRGARLHIIDYLQLAWIRDIDNASARITEVSHAVRQVAKELQVVTFGLSQLNRETTKDGGKPRKEGMIGASALENDANQVVLLDHSRVRELLDPRGFKTGWTSWLLLDKNRHGPSAEIPIEFRADTGRMRQRLPDEVESWEVAK